MSQDKLKIKLGVIGYLPFEINRKEILNYQSDFFEIIGEIEDYHLTQNSDTYHWGYSDELLNQELPQNTNADFFIGITYVPLDENYYARRLENNRVVLSYHEMHQILSDGNIPMENLIYRLLYAYGLVYLRAGNHLPEQGEIFSFTHDDTRGCLFDMNGNKTDVLFSLDSPIICDDCISRIRKEKVSDNRINCVKGELKKIKKKRYFKITEFIKRKPILSIILSAIFGMILSMGARLILEFMFGDGTI